MKNPPQFESVIAAARRLPEDERVPYAFEQRIMHALRVKRPLDAWSLRTQAMWRAAAACVLISLLTGAWARLEEEPEELLSSDLEQIVMAPIQMEESW